MDALFGVPTDVPYAQRIAALSARGIAPWDVLAECERTGSLDSEVRFFESPSISPAHAARSFEQKRVAWQAFANALAGEAEVRACA